MIYIIGHTKPDLDSAVATISLKYLFDHAQCYQRKESKATLAGPANNETQFIFKKFKTELPQILKAETITKEDTFILADHNEKSQRLNNISNDQITDIFDHHKISLNLNKPIFVTTKPWGSTNSIIWWIIKRNNLKPERNLASLMISAILSDTVGLKSATTTTQDEQFLEELNEIAQIQDINGLTYEIFKTKSDISKLTYKQILTKDYKIYNFGSQKVLINQVETVEQEKNLDNSNNLLRELSKLKKDMNLDKAYCLVTNILKVNSKILAGKEEEKALRKAFPKAMKIKKGVYDLGPLMSRKKEIAPPLEKAITD